MQQGIKMQLIKNKKLNIFVGFLMGAFFLCTLSMLQKFIAGFDPFKLKAYVLPFVFGGFTGVVVSFHILKIKELNFQLMGHINNLEKIIPICSHCKKIRKTDCAPEDQDSWEQLEKHISHKTKSAFSHGICPDCLHEHHNISL